MRPQLAQTEEWEFLVVFGTYSTKDIWKGVKSESGVTPILSVQYGKWLFGHNAIVSYQLLDHENFGLSVGVNYRQDGYNAKGLVSSAKSKDLVFKGYKTPEEDVTIVVDGYWSLFNFTLEQDVSGKSKGLAADLGINAPIYTDDNFSLQADANMHWKNSNDSQHIYGVSAKQIDKSVGRTAYNIGSTTSYSVGLTATYQLNPDWNLIANAQYMKFDDKIAKSPLVGKDSNTSFLLGATYSF